MREMAAGTARIPLLVLGWVSLGLGVIGIFLPVMPTTPFVLLAAWCFLRSSERAHRWLVSHRVFGPIVVAYMEGRGMTKKTKAVAIASMWIGLTVSALVFVPWVWLKIAMFATAAGVTLYILRLPTDSGS